MDDRAAIIRLYQAANPEQKRKFFNLIALVSLGNDQEKALASEFHDALSGKDFQIQKERIMEYLGSAGVRQRVSQLVQTMQ